jgi:hypothetical protein
MTHIPRTLFKLLLTTALVALSGYSAYLSVQEETSALVAVGRRNLGALRQGEKRSAQFVLENQAANRVTVVKTITTCACAASRLERHDLEPGETVALDVTFQAGERRGDISATCHVFYRIGGDQELHRLSLLLRAHVMPDIVWEPAQLEFRLEPGSRSVALSPGLLAAFDIQKVSCAHTAFAARLLPRAGHSNPATVEVVFDPARWPFGSATESELLVETTSVAAPLCRVPIIVRRAESDSVQTGGAPGVSQ